MASFPLRSGAIPGANPAVSLNKQSSSPDPYEALCETFPNASPGAVISGKLPPGYYLGNDYYMGANGQPLYARQALTPADTNNPVLRTQLDGNVQPIFDAGKLASMGDEAVASLPEDPQAKMKFLAKALFPGMSPAAALTRMGMTREGDIYYIEDSGKAYYAEPRFDPISSPWQTFRALPNEAASAFGPSLPVIGATAGALLTAPEGGIGGGMLGAAGGEQARQSLANWLAGDDISGDQMFENDARAGLNQLFSEFGGRMLSPLGNRLGQLGAPTLSRFAPAIAPYLPSVAEKGTEAAGSAVGGWGLDQALYEAQHPGSPLQWDDLPGDFGDELLQDIPSWFLEMRHHSRRNR